MLSQISLPLSLRLLWNATFVFSSLPIAAAFAEGMQTATHVSLVSMTRYKSVQTGITPWPLDRKRIIPTERPPLVDEI
jgi:hypothetical protein